MDVLKVALVVFIFISLGSFIYLLYPKSEPKPPPPPPPPPPVETHLNIPNKVAISELPENFLLETDIPFVSAQEIKQISINTNEDPPSVTVEAAMKESKTPSKGAKVYFIFDKVCYGANLYETKEKPGGMIVFYMDNTASLKKSEACKNYATCWSGLFKIKMT